MSQAVLQLPIPARRRVPRYQAAVPVDVLVLRSGIPVSIPGRALDLGERGMAAVLAGELHANELVGVEFWLPQRSEGLQTRARVCHRDRLRCSLEFQGMAAEQQETIRTWGQWTAKVKSASEPEPAVLPARNEIAPSAEATALSGVSRWQRWLWVLAGAGIAILLAGWWHWRRAWQELEQPVPGQGQFSQQARMKVPEGVMVQRVTHKVDPVYPDAAKEENVQGVVLLQAVIGRSGAVMELRPVSGPEVLSHAAMDSVRWWRFQPYQVNGEPVEVETTVAVEFRLTGS